MKEETTCNMVLKALRGATTACNDSASILESVQVLCTELFTNNELKACDIVCIQFSITGDLTALNPATALRHSKLPIDVSNTALFCSQEPYIVGGLQKAIRVLITCYLPKDRAVRHSYLNGAKSLRVDLNTKVC